MNVDELYEELGKLKAEGHGKLLVLVYDGEEYDEAEFVRKQHPIDWVTLKPDENIVNGVLIC